MALFLLASPFDGTSSPVVVGIETASQRKHSFGGGGGGGGNCLLGAETLIAVELG